MARKCIKRSIRNKRLTFSNIGSILALANKHAKNAQKGIVEHSHYIICFSHIRCINAHGSRILIFTHANIHFSNVYAPCNDWRVLTFFCNIHVNVQTWKYLLLVRHKFDNVKMSLSFISTKENHFREHKSLGSSHIILMLWLHTKGDMTIIGLNTKFLSVAR